MKKEIILVMGKSKVILNDNVFEQTAEFIINFDEDGIEKHIVATYDLEYFLEQMDELYIKLAEQRGLDGR